MVRHAEWEVVNKKPGIILIRDLGNNGCLSITNDAEYVYDTITRFSRIRVIYQDTQGEWAEIIGTLNKMTLTSPWKWKITFKPWHGEVWDNLTKVF